MQIRTYENANNKKKNAYKNDKKQDKTKINGK